MKDRALYLSGLLLLITTLMVSYRVLYLHYPLFPSAKVQSWRIAAE